jgi:hypothetical protein
MVNRAERTAARKRLENDVFPALIAAGFTIYLRDGWKAEWDSGFKTCGEGTWHRIIFKMEYGVMPMTMEINRTEADLYDFVVRVIKPGNSWRDIWVIKVYASGAMRDYGFRLSQMLDFGPEEVPF